VQLMICGTVTLWRERRNERVTLLEQLVVETFLTPISELPFKPDKYFAACGFA
jgi:hypothetical protein